MKISYQELKKRESKYSTDSRRKQIALIFDYKINHKILENGKYYILLFKVKGSEKIVDYWPDSSKWIIRGAKSRSGGKVEGFGLARLLFRYFKIKRRQS